MEPVAYLDSVQAEYVDGIMEHLKAELGVESTRVKPSDKPFSQLYTVNKLIDLMVVYRRYIMSHRGELDSGRKETVKDQSVLSYIYAHSAESSRSRRSRRRSFFRNRRSPSRSPA